MIRARSNGTFAPVVGPGQKVEAGDVVATIHLAIPVATFEVADTKPFSVNASVEAVVDEPKRFVACVIAEVQLTNIKVACPADAAFAKGTDVTLVTLKLPTPAAAQRAP